MMTVRLVLFEKHISALILLYIIYIETVEIKTTKTVEVTLDYHWLDYSSSAPSVPYSVSLDIGPSVAGSGGAGVWTNVDPHTKNSLEDKKSEDRRFLRMRTMVILLHLAHPFIWGVQKGHNCLDTLLWDNAWEDASLLINCW